ILDDRQLDGHAFDLLDSAMQFLEDHVKVISEVTSSSMERKKASEYPMVALREGIMNAIAHRDYAGFDSGMAISVYPERIEIWNSGRLPEGWTPSRLSRPHPSMPRNPDLCQVLFLRGLVERIGSGTLRILEVCRSSKLPKPRWSSDITGVTLTLFNGKPLSTLNLNQRQIELLNALETGQKLKPRDYYSQRGGEASQRHLQRDLSELMAGGWLEKKGKGPSTTYIRTNAPKP
ncbi:ATP-binding protein, partial [Rhodopirellula sallentina]|uniref:ATP-binding protein n=1 Tax=Rhodopirellula sallentina TaxID=1263869 RepID=UPI0005C7D9C5